MHDTRRPLGNTDIEVSACCLGTMTWGEQNTEAEGHEQMDYAVSRGINFFDTAEMYAVPPRPETQGRTEEIIGTWFQKTGKRKDIVLATKMCGRSNQTWTRDGDVELTRQTREQVDEAVEKSLKRLQTDYIDLYQLHWPDRPAAIFGSSLKPHHYEVDFEPFEDILGHLQRHVEAGRIRHIGVSNETSYGVMKFLSASEARGLPRMQSIQNAYSLVNRTFEGELEECCVREKVSLLAYSPLAQGYLTGKYRGGALPEGSRKKLFNRLQRYETPKAEAAINSYLDLADEIGADPAQLAIRFCDTRPFMGSTIIGATSMDQLKTCIDAFAMAWSEEIEDRVNALHLAQPSPCP
ncbi:MAG: aldo/keto reductase [Henriciella sp.]|jgi:aryl-alcohol dehydrogenase-like predicted oxidoreductase|uniref:aldo/keto reductase n=1 Tax=Henriciella sp. TaxID=1968823 RepID=UPI000C10E8D5|nr:aldo/keto reductase [Henriciella sp.]MAN74988.1 aldo/keto reductase [Henriciella sp.]MBK74425.1 aldo/keto reductase [Henriciella sp.]PHR74871.1 MAG: aldo/keto reductase [Henriciella sp.]|tara:strand:+ start:406 stop:1458 length:1053 start_codon:yes stop_codon:yes gene_type:complete